MNIDEIRNTVICADCLDIMKQLPDKSVDLVLTDPPYGVNLGNHGGANEKRPGLLVKKGGYEDSVENFKDVVVPAIKEAIRISKRAMVFCVPPNMWKLPAPDAIGGIFVSGAVGRNKWGWSNLIHCLLYGVAPDLNLGAMPTAISSNASAEKYEHPTVKPIEWMEWAVNLGSREGDIVLDCFLGSGTTAIACKRTGRDFIGIEISPQYCETARARISQAETGVTVKEQKQGQGALWT